MEKYVKNLPGRKTDMKDCQWQATLHAHGCSSRVLYHPSNIRRLQDYIRLRTDHITMAGSHEQHMQKALDRMNLKIHDVISDLTGVSGLKMIEAILEGQRNPVALLALCDAQIQKNKAGRFARRWRHMEGGNTSLPAPSLRAVAVLPEEDRRV